MQLRHQGKLPGGRGIGAGLQGGEGTPGWKPRGGDGYTCWNHGNHGSRAPRLRPTFPLMSPCLHSQSRHKGISSVCPQVAGGGATCPANLQTKSIGGKIAQVRFHPWSLKSRSANATAPSGEGRGRDNGDKTRLRTESCPARPSWLHNPASGQSHVQGTRGGLDEGVPECRGSSPSSPVHPTLQPCPAAPGKPNTECRAGDGD